MAAIVEFIADPGNPANADGFILICLAPGRANKAASGDGHQGGLFYPIQQSRLVSRDRELPARFRAYFLFSTIASRICSASA